MKDAKLIYQRARTLTMLYGLIDQHLVEGNQEAATKEMHEFEFKAMQLADYINGQDEKTA